MTELVFILENAKGRNKMKWKSFLLKNSLLNDLVESYNYFNKVVNGLLGTTAAYWSTYIYT